mmetsp:Transcript_19876/g.44617  ORF Transcript_19876/g.44617 Transcript_19876/m.44617 type:complete len:234 (+) Transcript_19876:857-1558(+)
MGPWSDPDGVNGSIRASASATNTLQPPCPATSTAWPTHAALESATNTVRSVPTDPECSYLERGVGRTMLDFRIEGPMCASVYQDVLCEPILVSNRGTINKAQTLILPFGLRHEAHHCFISRELFACSQGSLTLWSCTKFQGDSIVLRRCCLCVGLPTRCCEDRVHTIQSLIRKSGPPAVELVDLCCIILKVDGATGRLAHRSKNVDYVVFFCSARCIAITMGDVEEACRRLFA